MVFIPGGAFVMGSGTGREDEQPPHEVTLTPFCICKYAVTNSEYRRFLDEAGSEPPPTWSDPRFNDPRQPVVSVSWFDAVGYCEWLSNGLGEEFRLPTEAERERACRAGTRTEFPWGDTPLRETGVYGRRWIEGAPEPVGGAPNALGLFNMTDNVHEWCLDWYARDYYRVSPCVDPRGPPSGTRRVSRGGSWRHQVKVTRSAARSALSPGFRYTDYGFRVARSADASRPQI